MELAVGASVATLKSLVSKLGSLLAEEYALIRGVRGEIQFITDELTSMQAFLSNLSKSEKRHDEQTEDWMKQIRDVAYDIEDCIDNFAHGLHSDPRGSSWLAAVKKALYEIRTWCSRKDIATQIIDLKDRAEQIGNRRRRYGVPDPKPKEGDSDMGDLTAHHAADHQHITRQLVRVMQPVGTDTTDLSNWFLPDDKRKELGVLSIVGFGGAGKTTIATALYRNHGPQFERRAMVTVSQNSDPEIVWRSILTQLRQQAGNNGVQGGKNSTGASLQKHKKAVPVVGRRLSRLRFPCRNDEDDEEHRQKQAASGNTPGYQMVKSNGDQHGTTSEKKSPPTGSMLSRFTLLCSGEGKDGVHKKHTEIQAELRNCLRDKRYLLLIDDVWSSSSWLNIKKCFPEDKKGSRIIVTTRIHAVATTCSPRGDNLDPIHRVKVLDKTEARNLFQKTLDECKKGAGESQPVKSQNKAPEGELKKGIQKTPDDGNTEPSESPVPERVWEMCGGLPLALITMAGLVASKPDNNREEWSKVCDSLFPTSQVCHKPEQFMRIINHCYHNLDTDLKTCSLYLSIFPKGRKISRKRLTRRWIAEGFISEKQGLSVEGVAETCFNQLIERKLIRPVDNSSSGRVKSCQVHDMVLEYLISKAAEEDFVTVVGSHWSIPSSHSNKVRRLSVHSSDSKRAEHMDRMDLSHVRSLTVFESLDKLRFKSFKTGIVQVLDLEGCRGFRESHDKVSDISDMILLKYLSLRRTDVKNLPKNIHKLKYLETIDIRETKVQRLPATVGKLERIKNILGGDKRARTTLILPKELKGTMRTLRILSGVEIAKGSTTASDLSYFTGLRKLAIYKIHNSEEIIKELLSSIQYLSGYSLHTLKIDDESSEFHKTLDSMSSYPTDLSTLELSGMLLKLPTWIMELKTLVKLTLSATVLRTYNLKILKELDSLFSLTFSISEKQDPTLAAILQKNNSGGEIFFPAGGFNKLKLLRIFVPLLPSLNFSRNATSELERIELRFKRLEGLPGMDNLSGLKDVLLTVDGKQSESTKSIIQKLKGAQPFVSNKKGERPKCTLIVNESHG